MGIMCAATKLLIPSCPQAQPYSLDLWQQMLTLSEFVSKSQSSITQVLYSGIETALNYTLDSMR